MPVFDGDVLPDRPANDPGVVRSVAVKSCADRTALQRVEKTERKAVQLCEILIEQVDALPCHTTGFSIQVVLVCNRTNQNLTLIIQIIKAIAVNTFGSAGQKARHNGVFVGNIYATKADG